MNSASRNNDMRVLVVIADSYSEEQIEKVGVGEEPSIDFLEVARHLGADTLTYDSLRRDAAAHGQPYAYINASRAGLPARPGKLKRTLALQWTLAREAYRVAADYDVLLVTGEDIAIPFAWLSAMFGRRSRCVAIGHYLSPLKKRALLASARVRSMIDRVVTYSPAQAALCVERLGFDERAVEMIPFHADSDFYHPAGAMDGAPIKRDPRLFVAAGFERRDYRTLFQAFDGLDARLELGVGSPWSRYKNPLGELPVGATNRFRSRWELRALYREAVAVVVPLAPTDFQAGISVALEAMACGAPLILTATDGLKHLIDHERQGLLVPPGDVAAMRLALARMREDRPAAERMGLNAREFTQSRATTRHFIDNLTLICHAAHADWSQPLFSPNDAIWGII